MKKNNLVVLSGAGISAESGLATFRGSGGLWEGHDVMTVATPAGWQDNPALVLDFYNQRRRKLSSVNPNQAHYILAELESTYSVQIITQNVDDLHERAGSHQVLHLHGELLKSRSTIDNNLIYPCRDDILMGDQCENGYQLRPHIVWFGEAVPLLSTAIDIVCKADILLVVGTSLQVYPAASLHTYANPTCRKYLIDPAPIQDCSLDFTIIKESATKGMSMLKGFLSVE